MSGHKNAEAAESALSGAVSEKKAPAPAIYIDFDVDMLTHEFAGLEGKVDKKPRTAAIILAGGSGERFGREGGKQRSGPVCV